MEHQGSQANHESFEKTALPYLDECFGFALRLTRHVEDAEDLVQEAYLRAFRSFHKFEQGTNFRAWINKIIFNAFINAYRKRANQGGNLNSNNLEVLHNRRPSSLGLIDDSDPERLAMSRQGAGTIQEALDELPEHFRTVVHLADIEGYSYKEIASIVGCPVGTVMSRLHRARRLLQKSRLAQLLGAEKVEIAL